MKAVVLYLVQFATQDLHVLSCLMEGKESERLISDLKTYCGERGVHYGRRAKVAKALGISRGLVGDWLAGRALPGLDVGLKLKAFLAKEKRRKKE